MRVRKQVWVVATVLLAGISSTASAQWLQWGGPNRDFKVDAPHLADSWPKEGPKLLWSRDLGDGYSTIVGDGKRLYTSYHVEDDQQNIHDDIVVALEPGTGKTLWEYRYPAPFDEKMLSDFGFGPRSTPLIDGDRLFIVGATAILNCLDRNTGKKIWSNDLRKDQGAAPLERGYGASPLLHDGKIILPIGGEGHAVIAFQADTGEVAWKNQGFGPTYASPFIQRVAGEDQLIIFGDKAIHGLNPANGESLWSHPHAGGANISTPVAGNDGVFFFSSAYGVGSRGIQVEKKEGRFITHELYFNKKLKIHHGNAIRIGDYVYASSGDFGAAFFASLNVKTGRFAWKKRGITKANSIFADGKLIILDEDGRLYLTQVSPEKLVILSQAQLLEKQAWTVPTLIGKTLYLRDLKKIMAVDLG